MKRILLIDDDKAYTSAISNLLSNEYKIDVADSVTQAFELISKKSERPDYILLDILMPDESGLDAIDKLKKKSPQSEILMLSVVEDEDSLLKAIVRGASGYFIKPEDSTEILTALKIQEAGGSALSPILARKIITYFQPQTTADSKLSQRNLVVLKLLSEGWNYKTIAEKVGITLDGVRFHIKQIYRALNVQSAPQAVKKYIEGDLPVKEKK